MFVEAKDLQGYLLVSEAGSPRMIRFIQVYVSQIILYRPGDLYGLYVGGQVYYHLYTAFLHLHFALMHS